MKMSTSEEEKIVCILGTGFSKAIYNKIPLLKELAEKVSEKINDCERKGYKKEYEIIYDKYISKKRFSNFEDILTYIYSNIPWKTEENYNLLKGLYFHILDILVDIFTELDTEFRESLENEVVNIKDIQTISNFIYYLHSVNANVVTFNYDTIFETFAINVLGLKSQHSSSNTSKIAVTRIEIIDSITDDLKKYPIDIDIDKKNKILKFYYKTMNFSGNEDFLNDYYTKHFEKRFGGNYKSSFIRAYNEYNSKSLNISYEDLYRIPMIDIRDRGGISHGVQSIIFKSEEEDVLNQTLRLHKLHGSVNWFYSPNEIGTSSIYLRSGNKSSNKVEKHWIQDLKPIIIPPLIDKSNFMSINSLKIVWETARESISNANKIYFLGYSLPESDLTIKLLLKCFIKEETEIIVVDINRYIKKCIKNSDNIENRLKRIFQPDKANKETENYKYKKDNIEVVEFNLERGIKLKCVYPVFGLEEEKIIFRFIRNFIPAIKNDLVNFNN